MSERGKYIVFEGGEYTGKSTQSRLLAERLDAERVYEPGCTALGAELRRLLLMRDEIDPYVQTEVLLFAADRSELASKIIRPTLQSGRHVVSDRSWVSSSAYQTARGASIPDLVTINRYALGELIKPDLLLLLDGDVEELASRSGVSKDRYESMHMDFHKEVRRNFLRTGKELGAVVIDATAPLAEVTEQVNVAVAERLGL